MKALRLFLVLISGAFCLGLQAEPVVLNDDVTQGRVALPADDQEAIRAAMGHTIVVDGLVTDAYWIRSNVLILKFQEDPQAFAAVSFAEHRSRLDAAFGGSITRALQGQRLQIHGQVSEYRGRPQIILTTPEQIVLYRDAQPPPLVAAESPNPNNQTRN